MDLQLTDPSKLNVIDKPEINTGQLKLTKPEDLNLSNNSYIFGQGITSLENPDDFKFQTRTESDSRERQANNQSIADKWANGIVKAVGIAGTSALESTAGVVYGLFDAAANTDVSKMYHNDFTESLSDFNNWLSKNMPNYYTKKEADYNLLQKMGTANFWSDSALNGVGFMAGAIATGWGLGKLASIAKLAQAGIVVDAEKLASLGGLTESGTGATEAASKYLYDLAKPIRIANKVDFVKNAVLMSSGESMQEADGIYKGAKDNLLKDFNTKYNRDPNELEMQDIESNSKAAGNFGFAANLAITGTVNALFFSKLLSKGFGANKLAVNEVKLGADGLYTSVAESTKKGMAKEIGKGIIEEGGQESAQFLIQNTLTDYYSQAYKDRKDQHDFLGSLQFGLEQTLGTEAGLENFFLGALLGGPGAALQTKGAITEQNTRSAKLAATMNTPEFKKTLNSFDNFVRSTNYETRKNQALTSDSPESKFNYLNAEFGQNMSIVKHFIDNGGKELLLQQYKDMGGMDEDSFKDIAGYEKDKPLPHSQTQIIDNAVKFVENLDNTNNSIKELFPYNKDIHDNPELYKILTDNLLHYSMSIENMDRRAKEIQNNVYKIAADKSVNILGDGISVPFSVEGNPMVQQQVESLNGDLKLIKQYKDKLIESYQLLSDKKTSNGTLNEILQKARDKAKESEQKVKNDAKSYEEHLQNKTELLNQIAESKDHNEIQDLFEELKQNPLLYKDEIDSVKEHFDKVKVQSIRKNQITEQLNKAKNKVTDVLGRISIVNKSIEDRAKEVNDIVDDLYEKDEKTGNLKLKDGELKTKKAQNQLYKMIDEGQNDIYKLRDHVDELEKEEYDETGGDVPDVNLGGNNFTVNDFATKISKGETPSATSPEHEKFYEANKDEINKKVFEIANAERERVKQQNAANVSQPVSLSSKDPNETIKETEVVQDENNNNKVDEFGRQIVIPYNKQLPEDIKLQQQRNLKNLIHSLLNYFKSNKDWNKDIELKLQGTLVQIYLGGKYIGNIPSNNTSLNDNPNFTKEQVIDINKLSADINNLVKTQPEKTWTIQDLKNQGLDIYFGLTKGQLNIINPDMDERLPLTDLDKVITNLPKNADGSTVNHAIYDFGTRINGKYKSGKFIGKYDSEWDLDPAKIPSNLNRRYVLVFKDEFGKQYSIALRPKTAAVASLNTWFNGLLSLSEKVKKGLNREETNKIKEDINSEMFVALNPLMIKYKNNTPVFDSFSGEFNIKHKDEKTGVGEGDIQFKVEGRKKGEAKGTFFIDVNLNDIKTPQDLADAINKEIQKKVTELNKNNPDNWILDEKLTLNSFKQSVDPKSKNLNSLFLAASKEEPLTQRKFVFNRVKASENTEKQDISEVKNISNNDEIEVQSVEQSQDLLRNDIGVHSPIKIDTHLNGIHYIQTEDGKYYVVPDRNSEHAQELSKEVSKEAILKPFRTADEWKQLAEKESKQISESDKVSKLKSELKNLETKLSQTKDRKEKGLINTEINNKKNEILKEGGAFKSTSVETKKLSQKEIDYVKSILPRFIKLEDIEKIIDNLNVSGIPLGFFKDSVIYLNSQSATKGTAYHEAFHAVFRSVLSEKEITRLLSEAKKEYLSRNSQKQLRESIDRIRKYSTTYSVLSPKQLEELVYEEYMADKWEDFKKDSEARGPFRRLFIMIKNLLNMFKYNSEELKALFDKIENKAFVNSSLKENRYSSSFLNTGVFKLIPAGIVARYNEDTDTNEMVNVNHTMQKSNQMINDLFMNSSRAWDGEFDTPSNKLSEKSMSEIIEYFLDERYNALQGRLETIDEDGSLSSIEKERVKSEINKEIYSLETHDDLLKEQTLKSLKVYSEFIEDIGEKEEDAKEEELKNEEEELGKTKGFGSQEGWTIGGYESLSKAIKQMHNRAFIVKHDELTGKERRFSIDSQIAYNGMTRMLAGVEREEMLDKLAHSVKYNENMQAVLDSLANDTGMTKDPKTGIYSNPTRNLNFLQSFLNAYNNVIAKQKFTLINTEGGSFSTSVQNANKNDGKSQQISEWVNAISGLQLAKGLTKKEIVERIKSLEDTFLKGMTKPKTDKELDKKINEVYKAYEESGFKLSKGFIEYSLINTLINNGVKLTDYQTSIFENNKDNTPLDTGLLSSSSNNYNLLEEEVTDDESIPLINELFTDKEGKGALGRLGQLAEDNLMFDETKGSHSFKNADGKDVYELIKGNYVLNQTLRFRKEAYLQEIESGEDKNNDLNNKNYKFLSNNYLLNSFRDTVKSLKINLIDGLRKDFKDAEGVTFGSFDPRSYLIQGMAYFADRNSKSNNVNYIFRQNEASSTAFTAEMPVQQLTTNGEINDTYINGFYEHQFKSEFKRIGREKAEFDNSTKYLKYNDKLNGRAFDFTEFKYLKDLLGETEYQNLVQLALESNGEFEISKELEDKVKNGIKDYAKEAIEKYKEYLLEHKLIYTGNHYENKEKPEEITSTSIYSNFIPVSLYEGKNSPYKSLDEAISEYLLNDYLMSSSLNELFDGDYALSRKDKTDISKRNRGAMASFNSYGSGEFTKAVKTDSFVYFEVSPVNGNLVEFNKKDDDIQYEIKKKLNKDGNLEYKYIEKGGKNIKVVEHNTNDAQGEGWAIDKIYKLHTQGKLNNKAWGIYQKLLRGNYDRNTDPITQEDTEYLIKNGIALNSDKDVVFGMGEYDKLSTFHIMRHAVSYVEDKNLAKHKELTEQLIQLLDKRDFNKSKLVAITKQLAKLYEPIPGMEPWHKIANQQDVHGIDLVVPPSGSKGATLLPVDMSKEGADLSKSSSQLENRYRGEQTATPVGKDKIIDGSQVIQLISSEQKDSTKVNFNGKETTIGELRKLHNQYMSDARSNSFKEALSYIKGINDGNINIDKLNEKFVRSLETSGGDANLIEFVQDKYNYNMMSLVDKAEQLILAHFTKGVLAQKVAGEKVTLVSSEGINPVRSNSNVDEIINYRDVSKNPAKYSDKSKYNTNARLRHNVSTDSKGNKIDTPYSEVMLSEYFLLKHGYKVGDLVNIPSELLEAMGYRIPTQDKHSMVSIKIVGLLPSYYEGIGLFPHEMLYLSGADFDIDSLFIQVANFWKNDRGEYIKYGKEKNNSEKFDAYLHYLKNENKDFKFLFQKTFNTLKEDYFKDKKSQTYSHVKFTKEDDVEKLSELEHEAFISTAQELGLPWNELSFNEKGGENLNNAYLNNQILDTRLKMLTNDYIMEDIAYHAAGVAEMSRIRDNVKSLIKQSDKYKVQESNNSASDINGKFDANTKNSAGGQGIGIVANKVQNFAVMSKEEMSFNKSAFKFNINGFIGGQYKRLSQAGKRVADALSGLLSIMTDNAKDPIAGDLKISPQLLSGYQELVSQGLPEYEASLLINLPLLQEYSKNKSISQYAIKNFYEEKITSYAAFEYTLRQFLAEHLPNDFSKETHLTEKQIEALTKNADEGNRLVNKDMENILKGSPDKFHYYTQINALLQFKRIEEQAEFVAKLNKLLKINKGFGTNFEDANDLYKVLDDIGLLYSRNSKGEWILAKNPDKSTMIDLVHVIKSDKALTDNIKRELEALYVTEKIFISQTNKFKNILGQLKDVLKGSWLNKEGNNKKITRNLLGVISNKGYVSAIKAIIAYKESQENKSKNQLQSIENYKSRITNLDGRLLYNDRKDSGKTLKEQLLTLKASSTDWVKDNIIIKTLGTNYRDQVNGKDTDLDLVVLNTFAKQPVETVTAWKDAFTELYNNEETRQFAIDMFTYLISKDNLEFKNNSFVKMIAPFMFKTLSDSLDETIKGFRSKEGEKSIEKTLGENPNETSYQFRKTFVTSITTKKLRAVKSIWLNADKGITPERNKEGELTGNLNVGLDEMSKNQREHIQKLQTAYQQTHDGKTAKGEDYILMLKNQDYEGGETDTKKYIETKGVLNKSFEINEDTGNYIFPQFVYSQYKNEVGDVIIEPYELTKVNGKEHNKYNSKAEGKNAQYTKLEFKGDFRINPFTTTYDKNKVYVAPSKNEFDNLPDDVDDSGLPSNLGNQKLAKELSFDSEEDNLSGTPNGLGFAPEVKEGKSNDFSKDELLEDYSQSTGKTIGNNGPSFVNKITKSNYTRQEIKNNPDTAYVFTENNHSITAFPDRAGGGSAIIRGLSNAYAIVTKKKYDYNTRENVDYTNTDANFKEFTDINTKLINDLKNSGKSEIVFPQGFATDKAKMPTRFAEWLQKELLNNFGLVTELNSTKTGLISKSIDNYKNISQSELDYLADLDTKNQEERENYLSQENINKLRIDIATTSMSKEMREELFLDLNKVDDESSLAELIKKFCNLK